MRLFAALNFEGEFLEAILARQAELRRLTRQKTPENGFRKAAFGRFYAYFADVAASLRIARANCSGRSGAMPPCPRLRIRRNLVCGICFWM